MKLRVGRPWPKYSLLCKPHSTYLTRQCSGSPSENVSCHDKRHFWVKDLPAPGYTNCSVPVVLRRPATSLEAGSQSRCSRSGVASRFLQHAEHSCFKAIINVRVSDCGRFTYCSDLRSYANIVPVIL